MKRCLTLILALAIGLIWLAEPARSVPRTDSLRSQATAGMFKHEYDRLADNPAYVGTALTYLDYEGSITKGKDQLFTTTDGLNTDGRFLIGGMGNFGFGGIGGYVELGTQTTPYNLRMSPSYSYTSVNLTSMEGNGEATDVYLGGPGTYYDERETMYAEEERSNTDDHLNAKLAVGGIGVAGLTLGARFERNTDVMTSNEGYYLIDDEFGSTTGETIDKGNYRYTHERLTDGFIDFRRNGDIDNKTTVFPTNYLAGFGVTMPMSGFLTAIEAEVTANYLSYERKIDNSGTVVDTNTGGAVATSDYFLDSNLESDSSTSSALQYGIKVQTREDIMGWAASTFISWMGGALSPYEDRTVVYRDFSYTDFPAIAEYIADSVTTGTEEYKGDGTSYNHIQAGIEMRKKKENLLMGFGFSYTMDMWEDKYSLTSTYSQIVSSNDADGLVDSDDYTNTTTGSYKDNYKQSGQSQTFRIPIAFEYQATPSLCWRVGAVHTTTMYAVEEKRERASASDLYYDEDLDNIAGNETGNDHIVNASTGGTTTVGGYSFNTESRGDREYRKYSYQSNSYTLGLGYTVLDPLSIDVLWSQVYSGFYLNNSYLTMSLTYIF